MIKRDESRGTGSTTTAELNGSAAKKDAVTGISHGVPDRDGLSPVSGGAPPRDHAAVAAGSAPPRAGRFSRGWLVLLVVIEFAVLFALAEIVAGFFLPPGHHYIHPQMIMEPDARRTYFHRPNQHAFTIDKPFVTNTLGFRDERELPAEKGEEFRIFTLGDSVTVGLGVSAEDTYARQLEALVTRSPRPIRVVNGAVTCYGTWQEVDVLKEKGAAVRPDIVTLAFYWNDLYPKPDEIVPVSVEKSGEQQDAAQQYLRFFKRSRALLFLRERWASLSNSLWPSFDWTHRDVIYQGHTNPYLEEAYRDVRESLEEFAALGREGFVPVLLLLPIPTQVQQPGAPPKYMQERIEDMAKQAGLRTLDLLPALRRAYAEAPDLYIPWDYEHFTPRGHRVIAEALHRYLLEEQLVPSSKQDQARAVAGLP